MTARRILILGSTGSIGEQTYEVIQDHPDELRLVGLATHRNHARLVEQATQANVTHLGLSGGTPPSDASNWKQGETGLLELIEECECDVVVNAITGAAGLRATARALELGRDVAVANKESLVMAGELLIRIAERQDASLVPIDSEHSALLQCLRAGNRSEVHKMWLTASGGPFRGRSRKDLDSVTPAEALQHPTWRMGPKITVDSATLMNKALEILEAHVLFGLPAESIGVIVHPQSTVHSLVEFHDGSWIAHLGETDMRIPIQYALSQPARWPRRRDPFSLTQLGRLDFEEPDHETFPSLKLAWDACRAGTSARIVLNAANERAVELFLGKEIRFTSIFELVEKALDQHDAVSTSGIAEILELDQRTRVAVDDWAAHSR